MLLSQVEAQQQSAIWGNKMTNTELRQFFEEIINVVNSHVDIPIEAKRLALFSALQLVERQANEIILLEKEAMDAESIPEDKLAELS